MRYSAVISAVFIAATAAPALAAPSGLGLRAVEEDALAQRSFDDELYARDLIFGRSNMPPPHGRVSHPPQDPGPIRGPPKRSSSPSGHKPRPPPGLRPQGPQHVQKPVPEAKQKRTELAELYARGLMARGKDGPGPQKDPRNPINPHPFYSKPPPHPRPRRPSDTPPRPPRLPVTGGDARPKRPERPRELDELYARDLMGELFARALEDVVFARMEVDDLD